MRLLHVIADGTLGGGTTHVLDLLTSQSAESPAALATLAGTDLSRLATTAGVDVYDLNLFGRCGTITSLGRLRAIERAVRPHVIHVHGSRAGLAVAAAGLRTPFVYTVHGYHHAHRRRIVAGFGRWAERLISRRAAQVLFVSRHDHNFAHAHRLVGTTPTEVVLNGVPDAAFAQGGNSSRCPCRIGFVGRLEPPKDPLLFLDVLHALPGHTAVIVGGGSLEEDVRARITALGLDDRVRLTGALPHSDVLAEMAQMHVLVITSRWEAFGLVAAEALAQGLPVVAPSVGGLPEVVDHGQTGYLAETRNAETLALLTHRITSSPDVFDQMAAAARCAARDRFTRARMTTRVMQLYGNVAAV